MSNNHVVIMAGGVGSRFWPMSTPACPKQFIDVLGIGRTLIQLTADRFNGIVDPSQMWVVTSEKYASLVADQLPMIPKENILLEPCMRNTAPCIAYVAWKIKQRHPDANLVITPSDHIVMDKVEFQRIITEGLAFTAVEGRILTLGICPNRPETGYGYIQANASTDVFKSVLKFKEKPTVEVAQSYLNAGGYYWNSGLFLWNVQTIEKAFRTYQPVLAALFETLNDVYYTNKEQDAINDLFPTCPSISIDYGIMEQAEEIYVCASDFGWSDLGTWGSLHTMVEQDEAGNAIIGDQVRLYESKNCMVHLPLNKRVVLQGLDGYIIAEHNDTLLVCKLEEEQRIKEFSKV